MKLFLLVGNPNVGKSTLFNRLTRGFEHTGNWPGKTVECKHGTCFAGKEKLAVFDLPGSYSLTPFSEEEQVVAEALANSKFDVVVQVVDACCLERNLFLTLELLQLSRRLVVAINKSDLAERRGIRIDESVLARRFGVPFVKISARKGEGIDSLLSQIKASARTRPARRPAFDACMGKAKGLECMVRAPARKKGVPAAWLASKLVENGPYAQELIEGGRGEKRMLAKAAKLRAQLEKEESCSINAVFSRRKFAFISRAVKKAVRSRPACCGSSGAADSLLLNPLIGIPLFLAILWLAFQLSFTLSGPISDAIAQQISGLGQHLASFLLSAGAPAWFASLVENGLVAGVGSVLVFIPIIVLLFAFLQALEESGYMARVAVLLDGMARKAGFSGKAFLPLILGFGCSVPAIMATRVLDRKEDRLATMIAIPFMSCSARLPVYVLFTGIFFAQDQGLVMLLLYLLGAAAAVATVFLLRRFAFKGESPELLIELPDYHFPYWRTVLSSALQRTYSFVAKAGTIILAASVLVWFLGSFPYGVEYGSRESFAGMLGSMVAPLFAPLGFGTWQASISLAFGFMAKEIVIGSMAAAYGAGEGGLAASVGAAFTPLSAFSFMAFTLLYVPCVAALAAIKKECGSWRLTAAAALYYLSVAYLASFVIFQAGTALGF